MRREIYEEFEMSCMYSEKGLELEIAIKILENIQDYVVINQPPIKPRGGEVFLFIPETINEQDNYKCDQYRWLNSGPKEIPRKNPLVRKQYFIGKLPQGKTQAFQKHCYVLVGDDRSPHPVLLHYIGDETIMVDYPHGNSKKSNSTYFATAPSVRLDIANRSKSAMPTAILNSYNKPPLSMTFNEENDKNFNPVLTPRNKSQVRNIRRKQKMSEVKECLSRDDLTTLHGLSSEPSGFTHYIQTYPDMACIVGLSDLTLELQNVMKLNNFVVFSFHKTYKIGKYYITPFNFMHSAYSEMPTIPCHFLISEVCNFQIFKRFLQTIIGCAPMLLELSTAVITNQELIVTSVLTHVFPMWQQVYDWEILFTAARAFLRKLNVDIKEISLRIKQLKALMSLESIEEYRTELDRLKHEWPLAFCDYYSEVLREPVENRLGRWLLERYGLYSPHSGVYRCVNEDLQLVIKHLQELKEAPLDIIIPSLYHLQVYVYSNIQKGFCNIGRYTLCNSFKFLQRDYDELILPEQIYDPSEIVKIFCVRGMTLFSEIHEPGDIIETLTMQQAQKIVEMNHVSHCTSLKAFLVKSSSGSLHGVQLFPRETCSCSINQRCAHILAVMIALGMPVTYDKKGLLKVLKPEILPNMGDFFTEMALTQLKQIKGARYLTQEESDALHIDLSATAKHFPKDTIECVTDNTDIQHSEIYPTLTTVPTNFTNNIMTFTSLSHIYQQHEKANIVHVSQADLEDVLNVQSGKEVLMVVTGEDGDENLAREALIAYQQNNDISATHLHDDHTTHHSESENKDSADPMDATKEMEGGVPPVELILTMHDVMSQDNAQ